MAVAAAVAPPSVPRSLITPRRHRNAWLCPAAVGLYPATSRRLLMASGMLSEPPSVPRSRTRPCQGASEAVACAAEATKELHTKAAAARHLNRLRVDIVISQHSHGRRLGNPDKDARQQERLGDIRHICRHPLDLGASRWRTRQCDDAAAPATGPPIAGSRQC